MKTAVNITHESSAESWTDLEKGRPIFIRVDCGGTPIDCIAFRYNNKYTVMGFGGDDILWEMRNLNELPPLIKIYDRAEIKLF